MQNRLHDAIVAGDLTEVAFCLENGAKLDVATDDLFPLQAAAFAKNAKCIRLLLSKGAKVNDVSDTSEGLTPLMCAAHEGCYGIYGPEENSLECVLVLLEAGADPTLKDAGGYTVLDHAVEEQNALVLPHLLRACPRLVDISNGLLVYCCALENIDAMAKVVVRVDKFAPDGGRECAEILLEAGAEITSKTPYCIKQLKANRRYCATAAVLVYGILRKRYRMRIPRDMCTLITQEIWKLRYADEWTLVAPGH